MTRAPGQIRTSFADCSTLYFSTLDTGSVAVSASAVGRRWLSGPGSQEDPDDDSDLLDLPVNPDEGSDQIPDDERIVHVPS